MGFDRVEAEVGQRLGTIILSICHIALSIVGKGGLWYRYDIHGHAVLYS